MKIKFKKVEILANIFIFLVALTMCSILLFHRNDTASFSRIISVKALALLGSAALIYGLWIWLQRLYKSLRGKFALKIDELGIYNNILSKQTFLHWDEMINYKLKTNQLTSGKQSTIYIKTRNKLETMKINVDLLAIEKSELLDLLNKKLMPSS